MERLTKPSADGKGWALITPDTPDSNTAIERLAKYENVHEQLIERQIYLEAEMEKLREHSMQKSGKFKELLTRKLMNKAILDLFE